MSDPSVVVALAPILAGLNGQLIYSSAMMIAFPAIAAAFSMAYIGGKFLDCAARQPEAIGPLTSRLLVIAGLTDGIAMVSIAFGAAFVFANPLVGSITALLA